MKQILILAATIYLAACNNAKHAEPLEAVSDQSVEETAATSDKELANAPGGAINVENQLLFNGEIIVPPQQQATVSLTIGGIVKSTTLFVGQYVEKGAVIAIFDNPEFIDWQQNYLDAVAQLEYLEEEYHRQQKLVLQEAASQKRFQQSKAEYLSIKSKVDAMSARLSLLGINAEGLKKRGLITRLEVKSPLNGYVTSTNINVGKYINPGEPICDIIDKNRLMLELAVYEKDLPKLKVGNPVKFCVNGIEGQYFDATLVAINQKVDSKNKSIKVYAKLKESNTLFRPGMYVSAKVNEKE